jgi:hypothetical protein
MQQQGQAGKTIERHHLMTGLSEAVRPKVWL